MNKNKVETITEIIADLDIQESIETLVYVLASIIACQDKDCHRASIDSVLDNLNKLVPEIRDEYDDADDRVKEFGRLLNDFSIPIEDVIDKMFPSFKGKQRELAIKKSSICSFGFDG